MQKPLKKFEKIFLIDHALSFRYPDLRKTLNENPKLIPRLSYMLKFLGVKKPLIKEPPKQNKHTLAIEYEYMDIEDPLKWEVLLDCVTLSFYGNNIKDLSLIEKLCEKYSKIRALWLNENPVSKEDPLKLLELIEKKFPNIEILNSKFTKNAGIWALSYLINKCDLSKTQQKITYEDVKYLNLNERDIFSLENFEIFKSFTKVKKVELLGHELSCLENSNKFFSFIQAFPKLKEIIVEESVAEILWTLYSQKKLVEISKRLHKVNGFELKYGKPQYLTKFIFY